VNPDPDTAQADHRRALDTLAAADQAPGPAPNVSMMRLIHGRAPDGYIALERKLPDGSWDLTRRCFLPVKDLNEMFPAVVEHYARDGYHGMAVFYGAAPWKNKDTGLPAISTKDKRLTWARCKENLRWLPACFTDLDCGRTLAEAEKKGRPELALSWRYVAYAAGEMMDLPPGDPRKLPQATIMARSGRGLYLLWLLCDDQDRRLPVRALPKTNVALMEACNKELNRRLMPLAADKGAYDASRVLRIDGSWHSGAKKRVTYLDQIPPDIPLGHIQRDATGRHYVYTLAEMAAALSIPTTATGLQAGTQALLDPGGKWKRTRGPTKKPGSKPGMAKYRLRLFAKRIDDLLALEHYRVRQTGHGYAKRNTKYPAGPGYPDGFVADVYGRFAVLTLYAECQRGNGADQAEALAAVRSMAANCYPPYPSDSSDTAPADIVRDVYAKPFIRWHLNKSLCPRLGISAELADELHLDTLIPPELKARRKAETPTRDEHTEARRKAILDLVTRDYPRQRNPRDMAKYLAQHDLPGARNPINGAAWSHEIIRQDYIALNLVRRRRGRPSTWTETEALL
jgi:hypothetical protein